MASQVLSNRSKAYLFESAVLNSDTDAISAEQLNDDLFRKAFARRVAVWITGEVSRKMNEDGGSEWQFWIDPNTLARLSLREHEGVISNKAAREVFEHIWAFDQAQGGNAPPAIVDELIEAKGLKQMNDSGALEKIVDEVIAANPGNVEQFKAGKDKAFNALIGQIMKASKGKANPQQATDLLRARLGG